MNTRIILNDPPHGMERTYNGLRLAANTDERSMTDDEVVQGARRSTLDELTQVTLDSQRVLVF